MRRGAAIALVMPLILAAQPARANDTEAVLAGGVLTFKKSDGITMESEELTIAPHKVEVAYQFRNTTAADITTRVAFPMALCLDGFKKVDARTFVLEKTNFVPTHDLNVAFIRYND